jgi:hypothetical protein
MHDPSTDTTELEKSIKGYDLEKSLQEAKETVH